MQRPRCRLRRFRATAGIAETTDLRSDTAAMRRATAGHGADIACHAFTLSLIMLKAATEDGKGAAETSQVTVRLRCVRVVGYPTAGRDVCM